MHVIQSASIVKHFWQVKLDGVSELVKVLASNVHELKQSEKSDFRYLSEEEELHY